MAQSIELHVWGYENTISTIDPESRAVAWLLCLSLKPVGVDFKIVPSSNTNIADSNRLPVLLVKKGSLVRKYEGYAYICSYICEEFKSESCLLSDEDLSSYGKLINVGLISSINTKLQYINLYNLYINSKNYELYTRKLFRHYLPFPMMYNQPLKFYNDALDQVQTLGLTSGKVGFFSLRGNSDDVPTEAIPDVEDEEEDEIAISALHEKMLIKKEKSRTLLKEAQNTLRCLGLLNEFISQVVGIFKKMNPDSDEEYAHLFKKDKFSTSELLLYSYFYSLTKEELPDKFVASYVEKKIPAFWNFATSSTTKLNECLEATDFRAATGVELPSLLNEIAYFMGIYKY